MPARSTTSRRPAGRGAPARSRSGSTASRKQPARRAPAKNQSHGLWGVIRGGWSLLARGAGGLARAVARPEEAEE